MYARAPQTLIRIDIAHASQDTLVQQQCLDLRAPRTNHSGKFVFRCFQWIEPELAQHSCVGRVRKHCHAAKTPNVRVPKLPAIIQTKKHMRVRQNGNFRRAGHDLPGHSQMNQER